MENLEVVFINGKEFEEMVENLHRTPDYYEIALSLLYTGTEYQRKCINTYMKNLRGNQRKEAIKEFIDIEIMIGRVDV